MSSELGPELGASVLFLHTDHHENKNEGGSTGTEMLPIYEQVGYALGSNLVLFPASGNNFRKMLTP